MAPKPVHFVSLADSFIVWFSKLFKILSWLERGELYKPTKLPGPSSWGLQDWVLIGSFEQYQKYKVTHWQTDQMTQKFTSWGLLQALTKNRYCNPIIIAFIVRTGFQSSLQIQKILGA